MKKTNKVHPITAFRKANEARETVVKKSLKKAQDGFEQQRMSSSESSESTPKPIGATASLGNFEGGFRGDLTDKKISNTVFNAGYNNPKTGLGVNASYSPRNKKVTAGVNYNTTIGRNKTPVKIGLTYNKKGGSVNRKK
jgi:hypothetical protein